MQASLSHSEVRKARRYMLSSMFNLQYLTYLVTSGRSLQSNNNNDVQ